jgi:cell fate regulator YaaT (PSP1 superfamily)
MPTVVGVSFRPVTKIYYFDPAGVEDIQAGDFVVVETSQGREVGEVVWGPRDVSDDEVGGALKPVVRRATPLDLVDRDRHLHEVGQTMERCQAKVRDHGLPMKIVAVDRSCDGCRRVVSFPAGGRGAFRALVRDLARTFSTRIEMKQIGVRDEAKLVDGYGKCGRQLCCASWLRDFSPVTIKMAKNQNLPLNPPEISGVCGRLLCCLAYEMETYTEARKRLPKIGAVIETPEGRGRVRKVQPLSEIITVRLEEDESLRDFAMASLEGEDDAQHALRGQCAGCGRMASSASPATTGPAADESDPSENRTRRPTGSSRRSRRRRRPTDKP